MEEEELKMQQLRSKATELLLREDWIHSIQAYTTFISLSQKTLQQQPDPNPESLSKLRKSLCLALSNRAEARFRLRDFQQALDDCNEALKIDAAHFKTLVCKGKILLGLNRYSSALSCFKEALVLDPQCNGNSEVLNGLIEKCTRLDYVSRTGNFDVSDWVLSGFSGKPPDLGEFVGAVEIKRSEISGRGLFATKNFDIGGLILVTKAVATERCILPRGSKGDLGESLQLVMWKNFIDKVTKSASKCPKTQHLISKLSTGENEDELEIPDITLFKPESESTTPNDKTLEPDAILSILDVNSLVEDSISSKVLGQDGNGDDFHHYGVGLWLLPSFINHSCPPNARRLHIGDHVIVLASREIKAGEEITFAYYDVLSPLSKRKDSEGTWGFHCRCRRCKYEEVTQAKPEVREIELGLEKGVEDVGSAVLKLEECMRRGGARGKERGYFRASFWKAFSEAYGSEKTVRKWGRKMPGLESIVESLVEAVGSDERVVRVLVRKLKKGGFGVGEMERVIKLGRGVYGKVVKKQAMRILLEIGAKE